MARLQDYYRDTVIKQLQEQFAYKNVEFAKQRKLLGTGHAVKLAANTLESIGHTDSILVTMGDKYIEPQAIDMLIEGHIRKHNDFSLLTIPRTKRTESYGGRILVDANGRALGIVERIDIARQQIVDSLKSTLSKVVRAL